MAAHASITYSQFISGLVEMAHNRRFPHMQRSAVLLLYREGLSICGYEDEHGDCKQLGIVHDVNGAEDIDYCAEHFRKTRRAQ